MLLAGARTCEESSIFSRFLKKSVFFVVFSGYACKFAKYKYCTLRPYFQRYGIVRDVYGAENGTPHLADLGVHRREDR